MVKFGRHQKFYTDEHPDQDVIPYNDFKTKIEEDFICEEEFEKQWRAYFQHAREEFDFNLQQTYRIVFSTLLNIEDARGAPPEKALVLFARKGACSEKVQEVLLALKSLHATALVNAEALRKLVKKFEKKRKANETEALISLSCKLLPEVYSANLCIGLSSLQQGIDLLRSELGYSHPSTVATPPTQPVSKQTTNDQKGGFMPENHGHHLDDYEDIGMTIDPSEGDLANLVPDAHKHGHSFTMLTKDHRKDSHAENMEQVDRRRQELLWLKQLVKRLENHKMLPYLVAHRGYHSPKDRSDRRPMENSLQAYESAWTSGIHLCECDIALTKDEHLILAHDEDFSRLALDTSCEKSTRNVRELNFKEIMSVALKSGSRPPLLLDVLQSAHTIGGKCQLIIEIKPGNRDAASSLARMFSQSPHLMAHCAVVMSFDSFVMHSLNEEMNAIFGSSEVSDKGAAQRCYSMGILPVPSATSMDGSHAHISKYPRPKLIVLTVCDTPNHEVELQVSISEKDGALEKIHEFVKGLDGVYMQFEAQMVTPEGSQVMKKLARRYQLGIWGYNGRDPDHYDTFSNLVQEGHASFVNTDLPRDFFHQTTSLSST